MNTQNKRDLPCGERVHGTAESRLEDIRLMLSPTRDDVELADDGTLDTVLTIGDEQFRFSDTEAYRDDDGTLDLDAMLDDVFDEMADTMLERFYEYGLAFDYVEPHTFTDQDEGYLRFQISCGGPSEEIRYYVSPLRRGYELHRAEFWLHDWFDGAYRNVTNDERARAVFDLFNECGSVDSAIQDAAG